MTRLTYPKFKSLLIKGMSPKDVLETVFKKYKGTIHDTPLLKNKIKKRINYYVNNKSKSKRNKRSKKSKKSKRSKRSKSKRS
jgi:hypothetical protein